MRRFEMDKMICKKAPEIIFLVRFEHERIKFIRTARKINGRLEI